MKAGALGFTGLAETGESFQVLRDVNLLLLLEDVNEVSHHAVVEIFTTKVGVSVCGHDLEESVVNSQKGHIECTATKVEHKDVLLTNSTLVQAIRNSSCGGFVDDADNVQTSDSSGVLRRLTLSIVEIGWDSDDGVLDLLSEVSFSDFLHLLQDHGGDFLRCELLPLALVSNLDLWLAVLVSNDLEAEELSIILNGLVGELAADETLDGVDSVFWV